MKKIMSAISSFCGFAVSPSPHAMRILLLLLPCMLILGVFPSQLHAHANCCTKSPFVNCRAIYKQQQLQGAGVLRWGWMPMPVATRGRRSWGTPREENHRHVDPAPRSWALQLRARGVVKTGAASKHLSRAAASSTTSATTPDRVCRKRQCHRSEQHQRRAPEHEAWRDGSGAQASPSCLYLLL